MARQDSCTACGLVYAPSLRACPQCGRLAHAEELKDRISRAKGLETAGDHSAALEQLRAAELLVPPGSKQALGINRAIAMLSARIEKGPVLAPDVAAGKVPEKSAKKKSWKAMWLWIAGLAFALFKFKGFILLGLSKIKLLLTGFKSGTTVLTMLASLGVYWTLWGWKFALGFVLCIYIHEMGHVITLRRYGIPASAPMFIPGVGALVRLKAHPNNAIEDARTGAAGPAYGLAAALLCMLLYFATGHRLMGALAYVGAWINLFNLLPIVPLDGGRSFTSLSKPARILAASAATVAALMLASGIPVLVALVAWYRALATKAPADNDRRGTVIYILLLAALSALVWWGQDFDRVMRQ